MIWTADPEAVTGEQLLSFVSASRISLDPIAAAARVGRGVEADAVVVLPGDAGLVCSYFAVAAETTMPEAIMELSRNAWDPQLVTATERFAWEMIPRWIWRRQARLAAEFDHLPGVLDVPVPPSSDPLVLEVSEWWARRQTEAFEAELEQMALS